MVGCLLLAVVCFMFAVSDWLLVDGRWWLVVVLCVWWLVIYL